MPASIPVTAAEHRDAYRAHKGRADDLRVMIDNGLVEGLDPEKHRRLTAEYHDDLMCAAKHFALAALLETIE